MSKFFSPLNLLTIAVILGVLYLGYNQFFASPAPTSDPQKKEDAGKNKDSEPVANKQGQDKKTGSSPAEHKTPTPDIVQNKDDIPQRIKEKDQKEREQDEEKKSGFYESLTYHYQVDYPKEWPLKIRNKEMVAFGHTYPKNGLGAVKVEVGDNIESEVEQAKQQALTQPDISISEESTFVDGVSATKYIFDNSMTGDKDFKIVVEKYGHDYILQYSNESPEFLSQAERVVDNFKFTQ